MKLQFECREEFGECWAKFQNEMSQGEVPGEPPASDAEIKKECIEQAKSDGAELKDKKKRSKTDKDTTEENPEKKPKGGANQKSEDDWALGLRLRKNLMVTIAQGQELLNLISSSPSWSWAQNRQNHGHLEILMRDLRGGLTDFTNTFIAEEPTTVRKRHTKELIAAELKGFLQLSGQHDEVADFVKKLHKRHGS